MLGFFPWKQGSVFKSTQSTHCGKVMGSISATWHGPVLWIKVCVDMGLFQVKQCHFFFPIGAVLTLTCAMMLLNTDLHGQVSVQGNFYVPFKMVAINKGSRL